MRNITTVLFRRALSPLILASFLFLICPPAFSAAHNTADAKSALQMLKEGNARFVQLKLRYPNLTAKRRVETAKGQEPFATILSCADSRVPVELVFDRGIGDLFVIRVAGNIADTTEIGTAEYGVEHLGVPLLVVLGHTKCGAVSAAANHAEAHGKLAALLASLAPAVKKVESEHPGLKGDALIREVTRANILNTIDNLLAQSPVLRAAHEKGSLVIRGAIYDVSTGQVDWLA